MLSIPIAMDALRHGCGSVKELARDRVFSVTRSILFETGCKDAEGSTYSPGVNFRLAGAADLAALREVPHEYGPAAKRFGFERLERGDSFLIGECEGEVVFYAWLMHGQMDLDQNVLVRMVDETAYSYRVFTVDHARGRRICGAYYSWLKHELPQQGCHRLICRIDAGNAPSIRAHVRVGFEVRGDLWKMVLGGRRTYRANAELRAWLANLCPPDYFSSTGMLLRHDL